MNYRDVQGYFDYELYYACVAEHCPDKAVIVEVGVWLGSAVLYLAEEIKKHGKTATIFAVDTWRGSPTIGEFGENILKTKPYGYLWHQFLKNVRAYDADHAIVPMCSTSTDAAKYFEDGSVYMVFIDADHTYDSVRADIAAWKPKIQPGGLLSGHDYEWAVVNRAVNEAVTPHWASKGTWAYQLPFTPDTDGALPIPVEARILFPRTP